MDQTWIDNSHISTGDLVMLIVVLASPIIGFVMGWIVQRRSRRNHRETQESNERRAT